MKLGELLDRLGVHAGWVNKVQCGECIRWRKRSPEKNSDQSEK